MTSSSSVRPPAAVADAFVTPELLRKARALTSPLIPDYNAKTVDFTEKPQTIAQAPADSQGRPQSSDVTSPVQDLLHRPKICDSVLDLVGKTPMVRLTRLAKKYGIECELLAKCENFSAGGSTKDRIGKQMVEEARSSGRLNEGDILIEPTSGNTGIGLALAAALHGYKMLITMPEKMSQEKSNMMAALGAEIIRTPTEAAWNDQSSHIGLAMQLKEILPNAHVLDQYINPANPRAHYMYTAEEILEQCDNRIDAICITAGTGGTVTGIATKIKERLPACEVVGVDPEGSILATPDSLNDKNRGVSYQVEGIGYDFIPSTLHRKVVDRWVKSEDKLSFQMARELIRLEGLLVGGSSGAAVVAALDVARTLKPNQRCVVILPDSCRNYMTKFVSDAWMVEHNFYTPAPKADSIWNEKTVKDLPVTPLATVARGKTCRDAIATMDVLGVAAVGIVADDASGEVLGFVTQDAILSGVEGGKISLQDSVEKLMNKKFKRVAKETAAADVSASLDFHRFVAVCDAEGKVVGTLSKIDLLKAL